MRTETCLHSLALGVSSKRYSLQFCMISWKFHSTFSGNNPINLSFAYNGAGKRNWDLVATRTVYYRLITQKCRGSLSGSLRRQK